MKKKNKKTQTGFWDFLLDGLWADGILTFFINARFWIVGAWIFVFAWTPLIYVSKSYAPLLGGSAPETHAGTFLAVAMFFVEAAQIYFFTACYLNQQPVTGAFKMKPEGFVHVAAWLFFVLLACLFGWIGLIALLAWLPDRALIRMAADTVLAAVMAVVLLRLCLVVPLLANRVKSPLLQAWRITSGKGWRLFWNALVLYVIVVTPLAVFGAMLRGMASSLPITIGQSIPGALFLSFVDSALWVIIQGLVWAFFYSCCRTLYGEYVVAHLPADRRTANRS